MDVTKNNKYMFIGDNKGNMKKISILIDVELKKYENLHRHPIKSAISTYDNKYIIS